MAGPSTGETSAGPSPGLKRRPGHTLSLERQPRLVTVKFSGRVIAESRHALTLFEANYQPVHYIPVADVKGEFLTPSDHQTHCPFKGDAQYWNIETEGRMAKNAVWRYPLPYDEVEELKNYVSFYPGKVEVELVG